MAKRSPQEAAKDVSDEQLKRDLASQDQATEFASSGEQMMRRLEEMERRLQERDKALDVRESELEAKRQRQDETMAERLKMLEMAAGVQKGNPRRAGGSGKIVQVKKGDFIANNTDLGRGSLVQGGWVKCSQDDPVSPSITLISIAMEDFQYDEAFGAPYHTVKHQPYKQFFRDPNRDPIVGPPHLIKPTQSSRLQLGIAQAG